MTRSPEPLAWPLADDMPWLRSFVRQLVAEHDVDDVLQSTWLAAVRRRAHARPLLATIARRAAALLHRTRIRRASHTATLPATATAPSTLLLVERLEEIRRIAAAVCDLPEPYRGTLLRHHEGDESVAAIARADGITEAAVRKRLQRARELVLERLTRPQRNRVSVPVPWSWRRGRPTARTAVATAAALAGAAVVTVLAHAAPPPPVANGVAPGTVAVTAPPPGPRAEPSAQPVERSRAAPSIAPQEPAPRKAASPSLAVRVRLADGAPAPRAVVRLGKEDYFANRDGEVHIDAPGAPVPDRISARLLPPSDARDAPIHVVVRDGVRTTLLAATADTVLELRFAAPMLAIRGRVVDAASEPVAGASVFITDAEPLDPDATPDDVQHPIEDLGTNMEGEVVLGEGRCASAHFATTDADGTFVLTGLRPHPYVLRAVHWRSNRAATSAPISPDAADSPTIRLPDAPRRRVHGRVVDPTGAPAGDVLLAALLPLQRIGSVLEHHVVATAHSDAAGAFEMDAPATATVVGARSASWLRTEAPIPDDGSAITLVTDAPHALRFEPDTRWPGAAAVELLDAAERALPTFADGTWTPPRTSQPVPHGCALQLWTRRDAAIVRVRGADGQVLGLRPIALHTGDTTPVR